MTVGNQRQQAASLSLPSHQPQAHSWKCGSPHCPPHRLPTPFNRNVISPGHTCTAFPSNFLTATTPRVEDVTNTSSAPFTSASVRTSSTSGMPSSRQRTITLARMVPGKHPDESGGVHTFPPFTRKTFEVVPSQSSPFVL